MKWPAAIFLTLLPTIASGGTPEPLLGIWGTAAQCSGALITPEGTFRASPFTISPSWLSQGGISCQLSWFPMQQRDNGLFVAANAICGEDSARTFRIDFLLDDQNLTLFWDETLQNGPLHRCLPAK